MRSRTSRGMSTYVFVVISPATTTSPVVISVSHATRPCASCASTASRIESEIWSAILSGWPSVTDSDVKRNELSLTAAKGTGRGTDGFASLSAYASQVGGQFSTEGTAPPQAARGLPRVGPSATRRRERREACPLRVTPWTDAPPWAARGLPPGSGIRRRAAVRDERPAPSGQALDGRAAVGGAAPVLTPREGGGPSGTRRARRGCRPRGRGRRPP